MDFPILSDPTDQERQAALAAALRRQQTLGVVGQLTGDDVLGRVGTGLIQSAEKGQEDATAERQHRLTLALNAQKDKETQDYRTQEIGLRRRELGIAAQRAGQEAWQPVPTDRGLIPFNKKTGKFEMPPGTEGQPLMGPVRGATANAQQKDWGDFGKAIGTGARGSLAKDLQKSLNSAEALERLLKMPDGTLVNATPQQMREAYTALNGLIAKGGSSAVSQIDELAPETLRGKIANLKQYLLSEPQGQGTPELVQNILDTAQRESQLAHDQLRRQQLEGVPNFVHLRQADKGRFDAMLQAARLNPASINEAGLDAGAATKMGSHPQDSAAVQWAKANPNDPRAAKILQLNGGQ